MTQDELKQAVARAAIDYVVDGEIIGVGTGSTANFFIDELATIRARIKGTVEGTVIPPEPPAKVRAKALQAAQTNIHKIGDRVRVEWHGQMYPAVITGIVGQERYRIHYEGYGPEWDETVGLSRLQAR